MKKKILAVILAVLMVITLIPIGVFAEDVEFTVNMPVSSGSSTKANFTFKIIDSESTPKRVVLLKRGDGKTRYDISTSFLTSVEYNSETYDIVNSFTDTYEGITYAYVLTAINPLEVGVKEIGGVVGTTIFGPLPETITKNGIKYDVTAIAEGAFAGNKTITTVNIPSHIKYIKADAFRGTGVKTVNFNDGLLEIGSNAFRSTGVKEVRLPDTVKTIGTRVFDSCAELEYAYIGRDMTTFGSAPFENSGNNLQEDKKFVFEINSTKIPDTLSYSSSAANDYIADYSAVKKIILGKNVETMSMNSFQAFTGVEEWEVSTENTHIKYDADKGIFYGTEDGTITKILYTFPGVTDVKVPSTVTEINNLTGIAETQDGCIKVEKFNVHNVDGEPNDGLRLGEMLKVSVDETKYAPTNKVQYLFGFENEGLANATVRVFKSFDTTNESNRDGTNIAGSRKSGRMDNISLLTPLQYFSVADMKTAIDIFVCAFEEKGDELVLLDKQTITLGARDNKKAIDQNAIFMFEGEKKSVAEVLQRAGVVHVTCNKCTYSNIALADDYGDVLKLEGDGSGLNTKLVAGAADPDLSYTVNYVFTAKDCEYHDDVKNANYKLTVKVIERPVLTPDDLDKLVISPDSFFPDNFVYTINGNQPDENGVFSGLDEDTGYIMEMVDITGASVSVKGKTNKGKEHDASDFDVVLPENAKCGDSPAQEAVVNYKDDLTTATGDITVKYYKVDGETETLLEAAPSTCGTYRVKVSTAKDDVYTTCEDIVVGTYTIDHFYPDTKKVAEVPATCTTDGTKAYNVCACGEYYAEADGTGIGDADDLTEWLADSSETGGKLSALNHDYDFAAPSWHWSEDFTEATVTFKCKNNEDHTLTLKANTTGEGEGISGKIEKNPTSGTTATAKAATCKDAGLDVYVATVTYGELEPFTDETTDVIPALGHKYVVADGEKIEWSVAGDEVKATLKVKCVNGTVDDADDPVTLEAEYGKTLDGTITVVEDPSKTFDPTCTAKGKKTYLASFKLNPDDETSVTSEKSVDIDPTGHDYVPAENWVWTEVKNGDVVTGYSKATLTFTCKHDASHVETITCTEDSGLVKNPVSGTTATVKAVTCEESGLDVYLASGTFEDTPYSDEKTVVIPAIGHDYEIDEATWTWTGLDKAEVTFKCKNDPTHTVTLVATTTGVDESGNACGKIEKNPDGTTNEVIAATCENGGQDVYVATVTFDETPYTNEKTDATSALDHDYAIISDPWAWSEDGKECEIQIDCKNDTADDEDDPITLKAKLDDDTLDGTLVIIDSADATCESDGYITYRATFTVNGEEVSKTKTVKNGSATGHNWKTPTWVWTGYTKAVATFVCDNDDLHVETKTAVDAMIEVIDEQSPTCLQAGYKDYKATVSFNGDEYFDIIRENFDKLPHNEVLNKDLSGVADDNSVAWNVFICTNGCEDGYVDVNVLAIDRDGSLVEGAGVVVAGEKAARNGNTGNDGQFSALRLPLGEYDITVTFKSKDGTIIENKTELKVDGKTKTPVSGISASIVGYESKFRCSFCPTYEKYRDWAFFGWIISLVHTFVHMAEHIGRLS